MRTISQELKLELLKLGNPSHMDEIKISKIFLVIISKFIVFCGSFWENIIYL